MVMLFCFVRIYAGYRLPALRAGTAVFVMASVNTVMVNELLCFIQNNTANVAKANLINVGCTFYNVDEIVQAKTMLFEVAERESDLSVRCVQRRQADNKRKLDFEDIMNLWSQLDAAKVALPSFAAVKLKRIPTIDPSEADICALAANVGDLQQEVKNIANLKSCIVDMNAKLSEVYDYLNSDQCKEKCKLNAVSPVMSASNDVANILPSELTGSSRVSADGNDDDGFTVVMRRRPSMVQSCSAYVKKPDSQHKAIKGASVNSKVSGVPRRLVAFVSRLHIDTTESDLKCVLEQAGIKNVQCFKIVPKDGRVFKTSAFRVSCDHESANLFYDETTWPAGCELRDWVFYKKDQ